MAMREAHYHPESVPAGIGILNQVPDEGSTVLAQSANCTAGEVAMEWVLRY